MTVNVEVDPPSVQVGELFRVRYTVRVAGESSVQIAPLDFGSLELLSDPSPPQLPMMWGGGFAMTMDTSSEYVARATQPGRFVISGARAIDANSGRVLARQAAVTVVVAGSGGGLGPTDSDAGKIGLEPEPPPMETPRDPDEPPRGDLTGAEYDSTAFLRLAVDNDHPYLGQPITLRLWVYSRSSETGCEIVREPTLVGFWNESLLTAHAGCAVRWFSQTVGGRPMSVGLVRKLVLWPSQTGRLSVGAATGNAQVFVGGFFRSAQTMEVHSPAIEVVVSEPPAAGRPADYVPGTIGPIELTAEADRTEAAVGEAVSVTVRASTPGSLAVANLVPERHVDGVRITSGGTRAQRERDGDRLLQGVEAEMIVVPERPGRFDLGSLEVPYWDPARNEYNVARVTLPTIRATGIATVPGGVAQRATESETTLRPWRDTASLRAHTVLFAQRSRALATVLGLPVALALFTSLSASVRALRRRLRSRREALRDDPRDLLARARRATTTAPGETVALAARALERATSAARARAPEGYDALSAEARAALERARAACEGVRFAGAGVHAEELLRVVTAAVGELERVS